MRIFLLFLLTAALLFGDVFKLYLKDGDYHLVREYKVEGDRIQYFSTERGDWEEIPKELVDLEKTEKLRKAKSEQAAAEVRAEQEEDKALRDQKREIAAISQEVGAYYKAETGPVKALKLAEYQVITSKRRQVVQVPGKASVVVQGQHASFEVDEERPDFLVRLDKEERFGIIRLTPKKNLRVVENIAIVPVSKESIEDRKQVETFEQELAGGLYRIWPQKALTPGEYALVQFGDTGDKNEVELQIWDFAVKDGAKK